MAEYKTYEQKMQFYKSGNWQSIRQQALERDNFECQECKRQGKVKTNVRLDVDHIKEIETHPELALELDNLQVLCVWHHNEKHGRFSKKENKWNDEKW
jgi:5-methylcytosine-specific restriction endonuclease McrA